MNANVGELRQQSAFADSDEPVIVVTEDEELIRLLAGSKLRVVEFYPDTTNNGSGWMPTFKVSIALVHPVGTE